MRHGLIGSVLAVLLVGTAPGARADVIDELFGLNRSQVPWVETSIQAAKVRPLLEQLGSNDYRTREAAGKAIYAMGDRAIPALRQALKTIEDPEVARRVQVLARTLDAERLGTARKVTLKVVRRPAKEILTEIAKQTGYNLRYEGGGEEKVGLSYDFKETSFWEALDKVCDDAGLSANPQDDDGTLSVYYSDTTNPYTTYSGPFKIVATNINSGRNVQLSGLQRRQANPRQPESINLNFTVQSEPKAPLVGIGTVVLIKATDDRGASIMPFDPQEGNQSTSFYPPPVVAYKSYAQGMSIGLNRADRSSTSIKELRGKVMVALLSETRPELVIDDLLKVKKQRFTGRTVEVEVISSDWQNNTLSLEMVVRQRNADPEDYSWTNSVFQRLEVLDANGVKFQFGGLTNQNVGQAVVSMTAQYMAPQGGRKVGPPAKLQYVEWITVNREVAFTFKDIPLP